MSKPDVNFTRVKSAIEAIAECESALEWLEEYGVKLENGNKEQFDLFFRPSFAGSCPGWSPAASKLSNWAKFNIEKIVQDAITDCKNTIQIEKEMIIQEMDKY